MEWNRILSLPRELQVQILKYLTPAELLVLQNVEAFNDLVSEKEVVRKTDVCSWKHRTLKDVQTYLTKPKRRNHIRDLCLNNLWPTMAFLDKISIKKNFRNLHSLHIVNCNVDVDELHDLLMCLPLLEELSWSLAMFRSPDGKNRHSFERIKKFYVESYVHGNAKHHSGLKYVLTWFGNLEYLHVHFSIVRNAVFATVECPEINFENLHSIICTSDSFNMLHATPTSSSTSITLLVEELVIGRGIEQPWKNLWIMNSHLGMDLIHRYFTKEGTQVIGMKDVTIKNGIPQLIIDIGGPRVKVFQLHSCQFESDVNQEAFLKTFFSVSQNITELNLFNTHFNPLFSPCVPISTLHSLKKLLLPICCIFTSDYEISLPNSGCSTSNTAPGRMLSSSKRVSRVNPHFYDVPVPLNQIVEGCQQLTDLDIRQFSKDTLCSICRGTARWRHLEDGLVPIHKLKNLQSLTLVGLQTNCIQRGKFFEAFRNKNTEFPNKLTALRLYFIGLQGHQTYWETLSSALPIFSHLQDISLQHSTLSLGSIEFWNVLSKVKGLERLCLVSNFSGQLPVPLLQEFILQVPKLYVFHIHSRARNYKLTTLSLRRFFEGTGLIGAIRYPLEIVIQHFSRHIDLGSIERIQHEGKLIHMEELCVPGTDIAQVRRKCGLQPIL